MLIINQKGSDHLERFLLEELAEDNGTLEDWACHAEALMMNAGTKPVTLHLLSAETRSGDSASITLSATWFTKTGI
jgi:hypothetical protein